MRAVCVHCGGRGALRVNYRSVDLHDFGLCDCDAGAVLRREVDDDPDRLAKRFGVSIDRIWPIEELVDATEAPARATDMDTLVLAGKVDRAGLGGKVRRR